MSNNSVGFNLDVIDTFKKYKGYEGQYIIEYYIRHKYFDSVFASHDNLVDLLDTMDRLELWEDYQAGYVTSDGSVSFHIEL